MATRESYIFRLPDELLIAIRDMTQTPKSEDKGVLNAAFILEPTKLRSCSLPLARDVKNLFSLSQTSRRWRPLCQELLWHSLHLTSVRSVSRLQELCALVASVTAVGEAPSPLCYVCVMSFAWACNPHGIPHRELSIPPKYGEPIELAFKDRSFVIQGEHAEEQRDGIEQAIYHGLLDEPWSDHAQLLEDEKQLASLGSGPDWRGEEVIKSAKELEDALAEVVKMAIINGKLDCFMWESSVLPMPAEVSRLLASCPSITTLLMHLDIPTFRDKDSGTFIANVWPDCPNDHIKQLVILLTPDLHDVLKEENEERESNGSVVDIDSGLTRGYLLCARLDVLKTNEHRLRAYLFSLVHRLAPRLRIFDFQDYCEDILASGPLVHLWVRFERVNKHALGVEERVENKRGRKWERAAFFLRRALYHAAHIKARKTGGSLKLAAADIRALPKELKKPEAVFYTARPKLPTDKPQQTLAEALQALKLKGIVKQHPIAAYFPYFEDPQIVKDVAETWNELVDLEEHNLVRCECGEC